MEVRVNRSSKDSVDLQIIKSAASNFSQSESKRLDNKKQTSGDMLNIDMSGVYKGLTVLADEVIKKLNEVLKNDLPNGIASLKPEDHTPDKTADRIVSGVLSLMSAYSKQNADLKGEELLDGFMKTIRKGIKSGYDDAMGILGNIGALEFDEVGNGIAKTMSLVDEKLAAFESDYRKNLKAEESSSTAKENVDSTETSTETTS